MNFPIIVVVAVATALAFGFTNGFHDTTNAMATSIATGALRPKVGVLIAGVLNLVGAFLSVQVARPWWSRWWPPSWPRGSTRPRGADPVTAHDVNDVPTAGAEPVGTSA